MVELTVSMHLQQFEDLKLQKCSGGVFSQIALKPCGACMAYMLTSRFLRYARQIIENRLSLL